MIGTGATAVQLIPQIAKRAAALTVYQRTPIWVTPKNDFKIPGRLQTAVRRPAVDPAGRARAPTAPGSRG